MVFRKILDWFLDFKERRRIKKKLEELRKRDPFIYK